MALESAEPSISIWFAALPLQLLRVSAFTLLQTNSVVSLCSSVFIGGCLLIFKFRGAKFRPMGLPLEIERKFLVKRPPPGWKRRPAKNIIQGYLPGAPKNLEIRLRRYGSQHLITIKGGHGRRRFEEEIKIPRTKFQSLWPW